MKLLSFLVFVLACLSVAFSDNECSPLVTPLSLDDHQKILGTRTFISGYTDHDVYNAILKITESTRMTFSESAASKDVVVYEEMRMNGTCYGTKLNISIQHDVASTAVANISSSFHLLPTCDGCLVLSINSSAHHLSSFLEAFHIHMPQDIAIPDVVNVHAVYLFAGGDHVKDADLDHFKKQAHCLGFSGEPNFLFDPKEGFCDGSKITMLT
ncbi:uncharacterized protein LOC129172913 [Dunckerocampus dactyliophorus]|uniref:uncharacterized protein LOC129172913 n=1 Tax=Dunckerocampus dactyliophorus TaxID=161453 RepID=UPI002407004E|nr:uncharacterized protein LOC129172913 [Dunckerocampus dactyliophorus]